MDIRKSSLSIFLTICLFVSGSIAAVAASGEIVIDGYYDDWEDKPHAEVYQGQNPKPKQINLVAMFRDDERLCVHIVFAEQYSSGIKNLEVEVITNLGSVIYELEESSVYEENIMLIEPVPGEAEIQGEELPDREIQEIQESVSLPETSTKSLFTRLLANLFAYAEDEEDAQEPGKDDDISNGEELSPEEAGDSGEAEGDESADEVEGGEEEPDDETDEELNELESPKLPAEMTNQSAGSIREFTVKLGGAPVGTGRMTLAGKTVVEAEFCVPLYTISEQVDGITDMSMQIKKLGKQWLYWSGVGTVPYSGIVLSIAVAALGMVIHRNRKKQVNTKAEE